LSRLRKW
jgi:rubrerythrin